MTQRTVVSLIDDLDGSEAEETVTFALDGQTYEIDLNDEHASQLRERIEEFSQHARKAGGRTGSRPATARPTSRFAPDTGAIREWATQQGHAVSARGRIARAIVDAYHAAVNGASENR